MNIYYSLVFLSFSICAMNNNNNQLSRSAITIYATPDDSLLKKIDDPDCSICFDGLIEKPQKPLVVAHCKTFHVFHDKCLKEWLDKEKNCPICRNDIDTENLNDDTNNLEDDAEGVKNERDFCVGSFEERAKKTISSLLSILCLPVEHPEND